MGHRTSSTCASSSQTCEEVIGNCLRKLRIEQLATRHSSCPRVSQHNAHNKRDAQRFTWICKSAIVQNICVVVQQLRAKRRLAACRTQPGYRHVLTFLRRRHACFKNCTLPPRSFSSAGIGLGITTAAACRGALFSTACCGGRVAAVGVVVALPLLHRREAHLVLRGLSCGLLPLRPRLLDLHRRTPRRAGVA